jgi:hypothetical protein
VAPFWDCAVRGTRPAPGLSVSLDTVPWAGTHDVYEIRITDAAAFVDIP